MKSIMILFFLTVFGIFGFFNSFAEGVRNTIQVTITGVPNQKGKVAIGLYNREGSFPADENMLQGHTIRADAKEMVVMFTGLPDGEYAVAVIHDENNNEMLDKNMLGIPKEAYGFSNSAHGIIGPPSFQDAKITLSGNKTTKTVVHVE